MAASCRFLIVLLIGSILIITPGLTAQPLPTGALTNLNPDPAGEPWIAGGISPQEWEQSLSSLPELQFDRPRGLPKSMALPVRINNATRPEFRPIFNQKGGSCAQASAVGYVYTYEINCLRNLTSNVLENQYPYDFTYNFLNKGSGSVGSTSSSGWSIIEAIGIPNAKDYGGFGLGQHSRWISGHDVYHRGMSNRLRSQFSISIRSAADIEKMRQWLVDRGNGSSEGGCLVFGAEVTGEKIMTLATGTPQAGKKAIVAFGSGGGHAMTIAGYDDEVRYDYNGDGQYTNTVDLNADGSIDVRDWEIGAAFMVNSWGTGWQGNGTVYVMYRCLAETKANGGISSNRVSGIRVDSLAQPYTPKLVYKVRLSHDNREALRLRAGYSSSISATAPTSLETFSRSFNYCGGVFPMQGVNTDPIEIGLDVSEFLARLTGTQAAFFLEITTTAGSGQVQNFSVIDYTSTQPREYVCANRNATLVSGTLLLKVIRSAAALQLVSPNGNEQWERGRSFEIVWSSTFADSLKIELLKAGTVASVIASAAPNSGSFAWSVPAGLTLGSDYRIRLTSVRDPSKTDESDAAFTIAEKSTIQITSPNGGEMLEKGSTVNVAWTSSLTGKVKLVLYSGGIVAGAIVGEASATGTYAWKIPATLSSGFNYRVRVSGIGKDWLYDESDRDLAIVSTVRKAPYTQNFDLFTTGDSLEDAWEQLVDDEFEWTILSGLTPSRANTRSGGTGAKSDHTSGSGKYVYTEASEPNNPGKDANMLSPCIDVSTVKNPELRFWYHMYSISDTGMGALWVDVYSGGVWREKVCELTGDQGDQWRLQTIPLGPYGGTHVQVRFRVRTGLDYDGDICIDDFQVLAGQIVLTGNEALRPQRNLVSFGSRGILVTGFTGVARITALDGTVVASRSIRGRGSMDTSTLPRGIYVLKLGRRTVRFPKPF